MKEKTIDATANLIVIGIVLGVVALIMLLIPNRYEFSVQTNGVLGRLGDEGFSEPRYIKIDGVYTTSIFKPDVFSGKFIVEGVDLTSDGSVVTINADSNVGNLMMYINFDRLRDYHKDATNTLGTIFFSPKFEYFTILISEPTDSFALRACDSKSRIFFSGDVGKTSETIVTRAWNIQNGLFLSGPANNRSEALRILYKLLKESPHYDSVVFR